MPETLRRATLVLEDDGTIRSSTGEYVESQVEGTDKPVGRKRLSDSDLATALPDQAATLAQIDNLLADLTEVTAERDALIAEHGPKPRYVSKSVVIERLADAGLADAAWSALKADAGLLAAWNEAGSERLNVEDPRVPAFIGAIGGDQDVILAA